MPNRTGGPRFRDDADWRHAWDAIAQLAAARSALEADLLEPPPRSPSPSDQAGDPRPFPAFDSARARQEQLERDLAEIAAVAGELRRAEPTLAPWNGPQAPLSDPRSPIDTWTLMGLIWTALCLGAGALVIAVLHLM